MSKLKMPRASGVEESLYVEFDISIDSGHWQLKPWTETGALDLYRERAFTLVNQLLSHAPQGLVDHILAELMRRKVTVLSPPAKATDS